MSESLHAKFLSMTREDGLVAAGKATSHWLKRQRNKTFRRRTVALAKNYLEPNGWRNRLPLDRRGPIPWFTYPAIEFLRDILSSEMRVFEYGSGFSTRFFNAHASEVVSVEHDEEWACRLLGDGEKFDIRVRPRGYRADAVHAEILHGYHSLNLEEPVSGVADYDVAHGLLNSDFLGYAMEILTKPPGHFDVVVVDGMARLLTGYVASKTVAQNGFIILDNSDRWQYNGLHKYLIEHGYGRVDFWGPGPINSIAWCTSFFSRRFSIENLAVQRPVGGDDLGW